MKKSHIIWSVEEIEKFLNQCKMGSHYLTFLLAISTGIRKKEILSLKWEDINFEKKIIKVKRTKNLNNTRLDLYISEYIINELIIQRKLQEEQKKAIGELYNDFDLVICTNTGNSESVKSIDYELKLRAENAKVRLIKFNEIQYTHRVLLFEAFQNYRRSQKYKLFQNPYNDRISGYIPSVAIESFLSTTLPLEDFRM